MDIDLNTAPDDEGAELFDLNKPSAEEQDEVDGGTKPRRASLQPCCRRKCSLTEKNASQPCFPTTSSPNKTLVT